MKVALGEPVYSGPFDGALLRPSMGNEFIWTDGKRCYSRFRVGRSLYRRVRDGAGNVVLFFVGYVYVECGDCGVFHRRGPKRCSMCGTRL